MDVIAIYPAFDYSINEMAMVWKKICANGTVRCFVVTGNSDVLKKSNSTLLYEHSDGLEIHRFTKPLESHNTAISLLAKKIKPQLIFCAVSYNMPTALMIQKHTNAPIILHTEYFLDKEKLVNRRHYLGIKFLQSIAHYLYARWCIQKTAKVLCSDPLDFKGESVNEFEKLRYLPWPHPGGRGYTELEQRDVKSSVYIGSLSKWKGVEALHKFYAHLLRHQSDFHLKIIGPALDSEAKEAINSLKKLGNERVEIRESCTRSEALRLIGKSFFIFSPLDSMGWGLIGDAWTVGTPVISIGEHYDLKDGVNCWITPNPDDFLAAIQYLKNNPDLWQKLSTEGIKTAQSHSVEAVASILQDELLLSWT
jgi:glycosyltransferase involved in cell wall biosynthesis